MMNYREKFEEWCWKNNIDTLRVSTSGAYFSYRASWCWKCLAAVLGLDEYKYEDSLQQGE